MRFPLLIVLLLSSIACAERMGVEIAMEDDSLLVVSHKDRRKLKKSKNEENKEMSDEESGDHSDDEDEDYHPTQTPGVPTGHPTTSHSSAESPSTDETEHPTLSGSAKSSSRSDIKERKRYYSDKKMSKLSKNKKSMSNKSTYSTKGKGGSSGKGKGKGKGGGSSKSKGKGKGSGKGMMGPTPPGRDCRSSVAETLVNVVPDVITKNPSQCCDFDGPIGVYVTHALPNNSTVSGFDPFWNLIYEQIDHFSALTDVCFVMTGVDSASDRTLSDIITDATVLASSLPETIAMMVTDPTTDLVLMNEIRFIVNDAGLPSIGVFNAGYNNIVIESLVSGQDRIPYIGFMNDADYGTEAARFSKDLLDGVPAVPLCFNGRPELDFVGERCAAYYTELTTATIDPIFGVACSVDSSVEEVFNALVDSGANTVFSHIDCCQVVSDAVGMARSMGQTIVAVGCQDEDPTGGEIDFVTTQPILLEAYSPASWVNFPVRQALLGNNGRAEEYFPSVSSLVNTAIYTIPVM